MTFRAPNPQKYTNITKTQRTTVTKKKKNIIIQNHPNSSMIKQLRKRYANNRPKPPTKISYPLDLSKFQKNLAKLALPERPSSLFRYGLWLTSSYIIHLFG